MTTQLAAKSAHPGEAVERVNPHLTATSRIELDEALKQYVAMHALIGAIGGETELAPEGARPALRGIATNLADEALKIAVTLSRRVFQGHRNALRERIAEVQSEGDSAMEAALYESAATSLEVRTALEKELGSHERHLGELLKSDEADPFANEKVLVEEAQEALARNSAALEDSEKSIEQLKEELQKLPEDQKEAALKKQLEQLEEQVRLNEERETLQKDLDDAQNGLTAAREALREADSSSCGSLTIRRAFDQITRLLDYVSTHGSPEDVRRIAESLTRNLQVEMAEAHCDIRKDLNRLRRESLPDGPRRADETLLEKLANTARQIEALFDMLDGNTHTRLDEMNIRALLTPNSSPATRPELLEDAKEAVLGVFGPSQGIVSNAEVANAGLLYLMRDYDSPETQAVIHDLVLEAASRGEMSKRQGEVFFQLLSMDDTGLDSYEMSMVIRASGMNPTLLTHVLAWDSLKDEETRASVGLLIRTGDPLVSAVAEGALSTERVNYSLPQGSSDTQLSDEEAYARIGQLTNPRFKAAVKAAPEGTLASLKEDILRVFNEGEHSQAEILVADVAISVLMRQYKKHEVQATFHEINEAIREKLVTHEGPINGGLRDAMMTSLMMCDTELTPEAVVSYLELSEKMEYPYLAHHVLAWVMNPGADDTVREWLSRRAMDTNEPFSAAAAQGLLGAPAT